MSGLGLPTSATTRLRLVRGAPLPQVPALKVVGIDEWGWRRGHRYGTMVVDLKTYRVVDLLPDRSAASVAAWLAQHPTITAVCRECSDLYADGIRRGAPDAVQVVDRFLLVHTLRHALEAFLIDHRLALQAAAVCTAMALTPLTGPVPVTPMYRGRRQSAQTQPQQKAERPARHARWVAIYETLRMHHEQGTPVTTIARQLGTSRPTVYAYLRRNTPPGPTRFQWRPSARVLTPCLPYLSQGPSARAVSFAMVCLTTKRSSHAQTYLDQLCQMNAGTAREHGLSHALLAMIRERRGHDVEAWMADVGCGTT
jgi:Transposase/Helix-turn-helix domain of resolvase